MDRGRRGPFTPAHRQTAASPDPDHILLAGIMKVDDFLLNEISPMSAALHFYICVMYKVS